MPQLSRDELEKVNSDFVNTLQKMRTEHDPIDMVRARILDEKWASEDDLKKIDRAVKDTVSAAAEFAQESPEPHPDELWTDIYAPVGEGAR